MDESVAAALTGDLSYDALRDDQQAAVRLEWQRRIAAALASLDFEAEFRASGMTWVEADMNGDPVTRP